MKHTNPIDPESFLYRMAYWWRKEQPVHSSICSRFWRFIFSLFMTPLAFMFGWFIFGYRPAVLKGDPPFDNESVYVRKKYWSKWREGWRWRSVPYDHLPRDTYGSVVPPWLMLFMAALVLCVMVVIIYLLFYTAFLYHTLIVLKLLGIMLGVILLLAGVVFTFARLHDSKYYGNFKEVTEPVREYAHSIKERVCPIRPVAWDRSLLEEKGEVH